MTAYRTSEVPQSSPLTTPLILVERVALCLREFTPLDPPREWMRFCYVCESEQQFTAAWECSTGLVGCCLGCGDERIAPFTRMNAERV